MLHSALSALAIVADPARFVFILFGIVLGLVIGVIPGIGGLGGLALLIPFTYALEPHTALAFLVGMWAVTATSDTVPAILFGVPGAIGSASTILDGYPMAKRGEAGRAFGASFTSSVLGGLFGATLLAVSIPVLQPFMLAIGSPELLAVCIMGLTLVASVSQGSVLKGLVAAIFGVLIAAIGNEAQTGALRWTMGTLYLWDGVPIEALALGLFAVPELIDLAVARRSIGTAHRGGLIREQLRGVRDVMKNWRLVINSATIGVVLGSIPGMGAPVVDWVAYGSAARWVKGADKTFGTGDVRGVIASEASNNAREGGQLIPTLAFGVPGSASMALLLGAFMAHGIAPGPKLLTTQLDITYTLVWSLALANVIGAGICFLAANQLARLATIRAGLLVPVVLGICFVGAYQGSRSFGDLVVMLAFGAIGWVFKRFSWPRPPLILGFILGKLIEQNLFISTLRYGFDWLERPVVIVVLAIAALIMARPLIAWGFRRRSAPEELVPVAPTGAPIGSASTTDRIMVPALWAIAALLFGGAIVTALDWRLAARLMPQTAAAFGLFFVAIAAGQAALRRRRGAHAILARGSIGNGLRDTIPGLSEREIYARTAVQGAWLLGLLAGVALIGMLPALGLFMLLNMAIQGRTRWTTTLMIVVPLWIAMYVLFVKLLHMPWPTSLLGDQFPALRQALGRLI